MRIPEFLRLLVLVGLGPACVWIAPCPECGEAVDCVDVALRDAAGNPDGCDLAACTTCVDACGADCAVLESYPPRYECPDEDSWDVYAICPDWVSPQGEPRAEDIVDLGCGAADGERLVAIATGQGSVAVAHDDYLLGCCPTAVDIGVTASSDVLTVSYTLVDDLCDCACMLDVSYNLVNVPAGTWTIVAGPSGASTTITVQ